MGCSTHKTHRAYCEACAMASQKTLAEPVSLAGKGPDATSDNTTRREPVSAATSARPSPSPVPLTAGEGAAEGPSPTPQETAISALMAAVKTWPAASIGLLAFAARLGQPGQATASRMGRGEVKLTGCVRDERGNITEKELHVSSSPMDRAASALDHGFRELRIAINPPRKDPP